MSLTKLLKAPSKFFRKDVITFLIIRRHDLGILEESLRYVSVKTTASVSTLRQKLWHLLDLPDYCEESIVLKSDEDTEIPLTYLRKGNDPQHPYLLEVCLPGARVQWCDMSNNMKTLICPNWDIFTRSLKSDVTFVVRSLTTRPAQIFYLICKVRNNMLTMGNGENQIRSENPTEQRELCANCPGKEATPAISNETVNLKSFRFPENKGKNLMFSDYHKSDISSRISSTTIFKLNGRKNRDSFTNILLKLQSDLFTLSNKLSNLENRIPV